VTVLLRLVLAVAILGSEFLYSQHVEIGGFANYSRQHIPDEPRNLFGFGARADFNIIRILQFEMEMAYDPQHASFQIVQQPATVTVNTSKLGVLHGNAGLKLQSRGGSFFAFLKGGVNQYRLGESSQTIVGPSGVSSIVGPGSEFVKGILYPGAGIGFHAGPLGIRLDVGDEISWVNGAQHSLRVTLGPTFRF